MFKKLHRSDRPFSVSLAEELLRAELAKLYGPGIQLYRSNVTAPPVSRKGFGSRQDRAENELKYYSDMFRIVEIDALIGPFERSFPDAPAQDVRHELRRVTATIRLYGGEGSATMWFPHYLVFTVFRAYDKIGEPHVRIYESGMINDVEMDVNAENPCKVMTASQILATYAGLHGLSRETHRVALA